MLFQTALLLLGSAVSPAGAFTAPTRAFTRRSGVSSLKMGGSILSTQTGMSSHDPTLIDKYMALGMPKGKVLAEYVWVDAKGELRSKTRTLPTDKTLSPDTLPKWNFDGSSTDQAPGDDSEVILKPQAIFKDPFRPVPEGDDANILVMCDTYTPAGEPLPSNTRYVAAQAFEGKEDMVTWFGMEQEFTLFNMDQRTPLGWPEQGAPTRAQGPYYCSVGPENSFGRQITDCLYRACLYAGLEISGTNGEVMPGQQEYQVGPCVGIDAGDQLYMSRYILARVCEDFQVFCTLHPKPIVDGDWNGAGMHTNVSTEEMRNEGGIDAIYKAIYKLGAKHAQHIAAYGEGNELRLTGKFETADMDTFCFGVANRGASIRIGRDTDSEGKGYFEDRRPSSNCDPYTVSGMIMKTITEDIEVPVIEPMNKQS